MNKICAMNLRFFSSLTVLLALPIVLFAQSAERPPSEELLPESTVAYAQIHNVREMAAKLANSNGGQMMADERIAPLLGDVWQSVLDEYAKVEDNVGLSLEEIQSLPAGEVCFAVIAPRRQTPAFVLILDMDEESEVVEKALARGREFAGEQGIEFETEESEDVDIEFETFNVEGQKISYFRRGGTLVIGTNQDELTNIVTRWDGGEVEKSRPLKENRKFVTIMNRCRGTKDVPVDIRFFVDPISLAKSATRGNVMAQGALNFLPILGLDGLLGVGGAAIMNEMDFESVSHFHVLLSKPRAGIFEMIALKPGTYEPQPWVPEKTVAYISTSWDVSKMYAEFEKIYDSFSGQGALQEEIDDEINDELGIDLKADLIDQLDGRVTYIQWVGENNKAFNSQINALGVSVKDPDEFMKVVDVFLDRIRDEQGEDEIEEVEYRGVTYWQQPDDEVEESRQELEENSPIAVRVPQPCFGLLEDHLVVCDSPDFIRHAIDVARGKEKALADNDEFANISKQMNRLLGTDVPGAVIYSRPEETMKMLFNAIKEDKTGEFLDEMAEENSFVSSIRDALEDNPLPEFEEIKHYFPPSGAFVTNDETGYHVLGFQLKSEPPKK